MTSNLAAVRGWASAGRTELRAACRAVGQLGLLLHAVGGLSAVSTWIAATAVSAILSGLRWVTAPRVPSAGTNGVSEPAP